MLALCLTPRKHALYVPADGFDPCLLLVVSAILCSQPQADPR